MSGIALYIKYIIISIKTQLQYKLSFVLFSIGHFLVTGIEFLGVWALFSRFNRLKGWTLAEAAVFYGIVNMIFAFSDAFSRGFDIFAAMIKNGEFDIILIRPRSTIIQIMGKELTLRRVGRFTQGLVVFIYGSSALHLSINLKIILLLLITFLNGIFFFIAIIMIQAAVSFWTTESLEVFNSLTYGGVQAAQYPLNIYGKYFQKFFLYIIPLGAVTYIPICTMLGRPAFPGFPLIAGYFIPFAGFIFLTAACGCWRIGVKRYTSTGH